MQIIQKNLDQCNNAYIHTTASKRATAIASTLLVGFQARRLVQADVSIAEQTAHTIGKVLVVGAFHYLKPVFVLQEIRQFGADFQLGNVVAVLLS